MAETTPIVERTEPVPVTKDNEIVENFLVHRVPFMEVTEADIAFMLADCERAKGRPFAGDPYLAIYYAQEFLNGAAAPISEQLTVEQSADYYFGVSLSEELAGLFNPGFHHPELNTSFNLLQIGYSELEFLSQSKPHQIRQHLAISSNQVFASGPAWYLAHRLGTEEGAHAAYLAEHPRAQGIRLPEGVSIHHYFAQNDAEYDGLLWSIIEADRLLENSRLSRRDRRAIAESRNLYLYYKEKADQVRRQKRKFVLDIDQFKAKFYPKEVEI